MDNIIGPALPPHLQKQSKSSVANDASETALNIGPSLPPWMLKSQKNQSKECTPANDEGIFGPALPPEFKIPDASMQQSKELAEDISDDNDVVDDCVVIGPMPPSQQTSESHTSIAEQFEKRARKMKDKLTGNEKPEKIEREQWMVELPPVLQGFGMGPRTFRANAPEIGDRSVWTETPSEKAKKNKTHTNEDNKNIAPKQNTEIEKALDEYNKKNRQDSLLSLHEKKLKRKKEEEKINGKKPIRREFDRENDLQVNRFDDAKKKRLIKQSQDLSSRFSKSTTSTSFL